MSVIGDFTVPAEAFALAEALSAVPEGVLEADRVASHSTTHVLPFLWATGGSADAFQDAMVADPTVDSVAVADEFDEEVLFRMQWSDEFRGLIDEMVDHEAAIVRARASEDQWTLRLRFATESMVSEFQSFFEKRGHEFEVHSLGQPSVPRQGEMGLTPEQRTALEVAYRTGYFDIPRETSAEAVGDQLDISGNAASERLRRGCRVLVESSILVNRRDGLP